jgi:putative ABC transport system permease protein
MATKYFGDIDPVGKTLQLDSNYELIVTGIMENIPTNSHIDFDFVISIEILNNFSWFKDWWSNSMITYAVINSPEQAANVEKNLEAFMDKYFAEDFKKNNNRVGLTLQPLSETYFNGDVRYDHITAGDKTIVSIFSIIAIFILLIASINFTNLTTARSSRRAKEIGVRKTLGAVRSKLIVQFFTESLLLTFISILISIVLVYITLPFFNNYFDLQLQVNFLEPKVIGSLVAFLLVVTFIAGSYPAVLLSSFKPSKVLKGTIVRNSNSVFVRKGLVIFQFSISFFLIAATLLIANQLSFIHNKDIGFDMESVVLVEMNNSQIRRNSETFKSRLESESGILSVTVASGEPGGFHDAFSHSIKGKDKVKRLRTVFTDHDYVETFGLEIVAGRDFSKIFSTDATNAVLVNETTVKMLGWSNEEALGKEFKNTMMDNSTNRQIVGVVKDYHFSSLKEKIDPLIISSEPSSRLVAIKLGTNNLKQTISQIEKHWAEIVPAYPMEFRFLDDKLDQLYRKEQLESNLFIIFSIISIMIACLGSFALAAYSAEERTKEIGIRKILGSSALGIFLLLTKDFFKIVLFAMILATPITYYFMSKWLQDFAYQVGINSGIFIIAGLITIFMVMLTISWQSIKASRSNPVHSLRYE